MLSYFCWMKSKNWIKCGCFWIYCMLPCSRLRDYMYFYSLFRVFQHPKHPASCDLVNDSDERVRWHWCRMRSHLDRAQCVLYLVRPLLPFTTRWQRILDETIIVIASLAVVGLRPNSAARRRPWSSPPPYRRRRLNHSPPRLGLSATDDCGDWNLRGVWRMWDQRDVG